MSPCKNVSSIDRIIRAVIGIAALSFAFLRLDVMSGSLWGVVAAAVGVIMLGTAALGMCPLYMLFKPACKTV